MKSQAPSAPGSATAPTAKGPEIRARGLADAVARLKVRGHYALFDASFHPLVCLGKALVRWWLYRVLRAMLPRYAIRRLMQAHGEVVKLKTHHREAPRLRARLESSLREEFAGCGPAHGYLDHRSGISERDRRDLLNGGGIVLKAPRLSRDRVLEKGVLLLKNNKRIKLFCRHADVASLLEHYSLVIETSWSAYARFDVLYFTRFADHQIVIMAPEPSDFRFVESLQSNLVPTTIGCSDWVNPSIFFPMPDEAKRYDAVMVARGETFKRHHVLLHTLRELGNDAMRVAFVGTKGPAERSKLQRLIGAYRVGDMVDVYQRMPQKDVNRILNQSKVNVLLSLQEGGNRCLFEGFFAGVPAIALRASVGLPPDHFTAQTGRLISERDLGTQLLYFREHWHEFEPRAWAQSHIDPSRSTLRLNALLKSLSRRRGEEWTRDIVAKCNAPGLKYYPSREVARGLLSLEEILNRYHKRA